MAPIAKMYFERRAIANSLGTELNTNGWGIGQVREGFQWEQDIQVPLVAVSMLPSNMLELQMGRSVTGEKSHTRLIQVDCYMESEPRAMTIGDDVADMIDRMYESITDHTNTPIGVLFCPNTESIRITILNPNMADVRVKRWRAVIQALIETHYLV